MNLIRNIILLITFFFTHYIAFAQKEKQDLANNSLFNATKKDTIVAEQSNIAIKDSIPLLKKKHNPRIATLRSAIFPGLGQIYNREYWKLPIVYGALAIPTATFFYNNKLYKITNFAYQALFKAQLPAGQGRDSSDLQNIDPLLKDAVLTGRVDLASIQSYRNNFRRDRDYSILWFIIVWGLNVADATVFGHLKDFDVSNDLSIHITPSFNPITNTPGISLAFNLHKSKTAKNFSR